MADDFSELNSLAADLTRLPDTVNPFVKKAIEVTARDVKDDWRDGAAVSSGEGFSSAYPTSIYYDVKIGAGQISAEIGPEVNRPGGSAGFLEDAPGGVRSAPQHAGRDALRANEDGFVRGLDIAVFDATVKGLT